MDDTLVTGEYVSKKSMAPLCLKLYAISIALNLSTFPLDSSFFLNTIYIGLFKNLEVNIPKP